MRYWPFLLLLTAPARAAFGPAQTPTDTVRLGFASLGNAVWLTGQNAAGLGQWQSADRTRREAAPPGYGLTRLTGTYLTGGFRRPQEPRQRTGVGLHSEGLRPVGKWLVYGEFDYQKTADDQIAFSHGYDPLNGNPYLWADTLAGDWTRDHIRAQIALASPLAGRWRLGLTVPYHVGQGSRLLDPKPLYRFRDVGVLPSVWYRASDRWHFGMVLGGQFSQQENEVGFYAIDYPLLYRLRGYGSFSRSPIVSAERLVTGTTWKGTLQGHWQRPTSGEKAVSWLGQVGGAVRRETIREGIAAPEAGGIFNETTIHARLSRVQTGAGSGLRLAGQTEVRSGSGTDPILRTVNPTYLLTTTQFEAMRWRKRAGTFGQETALLTAETLNYGDQITRTDWSALRLTAHLSLMRRWERDGGSGLMRPGRVTHSWFVQAGLGGRYVPSRAFQAVKPTRLTAILTKPDYQIQTSNALLLSGGIGRDFRVPNLPKLLHRIELQTDGQLTSDLGQRWITNFTYSLLY